MKKTKLLGLASLVTMLSLGACSFRSNDQTEEEADWNVDENYHWNENNKGNVVNKAAHTFVDFDGDSKHIPTIPTCAEPGKSYQRCEVCKFVKEIITEKEHTYTTSTISTAADGVSSGATLKSCTFCGDSEIVVDALTYTSLSGTIKDDGPADTFKLGKDKDYAEYKFSVNKVFTGKVYLYGSIDYFLDGTTNNNERGFNSVKGESEEKFNIKFDINDNNVPITNTKTYQEMGMTQVEEPENFGSMTKCELGDCVLSAGVNTIKYTRLSSYNLYISKIIFNGKFVG